MIAAVLSGVFVVACIIWGLTWIVQIGAAVARLLFNLVLVLAKALLVLLGALAWGLWFIVRPRAAMARLKHERGAAHG